jgi:hypothetical protein
LQRIVDARCGEQRQRLRLAGRLRAAGNVVHGGQVGRSNTSQSAAPRLIVPDVVVLGKRSGLDRRWCPPVFDLGFASAGGMRQVVGVFVVGCTGQGGAHSAPSRRQNRSSVRRMSSSLGSLHRPVDASNGRRTWSVVSSVQRPHGAAQGLVVDGPIKGSRVAR